MSKPFLTFFLLPFWAESFEMCWERLGSDVCRRFWWFSWFSKASRLIYGSHSIFRWSMPAFRVNVTSAQLPKDIKKFSTRKRKTFWWENFYKDVLFICCCHNSFLSPEMKSVKKRDRKIYFLWGCASRASATRDLCTFRVGSFGNCFISFPCVTSFRGCSRQSGGWHLQGA